MGSITFCRVISSIRRFVDHDIWSMRRLGDNEVWLTTTYRLKFVELRRNSSKFSRKRTRTNSCCFRFFIYYYYYYLQSKSTVAGGIDCLVILYLHASSDCLESRMLFFQASHGFYFLPQPLVGLEVGRHKILIRGAMFFDLSKTYFLSKSTGNTREAVSRTT